MAPRSGTQVLSSGPKCKKMCLTEKIRALDNLYPGMSYSVIGCKFNVPASMIYINSGILK